MYIAFTKENFQKFLNEIAQHQEQSNLTFLHELFELDDIAIKFKSPKGWYCVEE